MRKHIVRLTKILGTMALYFVWLEVLRDLFQLMNEPNSVIVAMSVILIIVATYIVNVSAWHLWTEERKRIFQWFDKIDF